MRYPRLMLCCLALTLAGCEESSPRRSVVQVDQDNLAEVGELCRHYQFMKKKPPQSFADLNAVRTMAGNGYEALRSGNVVLLYGATLPDMDEEPGHAETSEVLAYQKDVPESGGYVLLLNRTVKKLTADEFKAAPRPAGSAPGGPTAVGKDPAPKKK